MLQLSACIELIYKERPFVDRISTAAEAGLPAVEFWGWRDKDLAAIRERVSRHGLAVTNMSVEPLVCILKPGSLSRFEKAVRASCEAASRIGCRTLTAHFDELAWGPGGPWYERLLEPRSAATFREERFHAIRALKAAAPIAEDAGVTLVLEPLNTLVDHTGNFLSSSESADEMLHELGSPAVRLLFDVYHQQITEGNLINNLRRHMEHIAHIHLGDVPGRHEPGTGEINFANVLRAVEEAGYDGFIGLEYVPSADSSSSLAHIKQLIEQINEQ